MASLNSSLWGNFLACAYTNTVAKNSFLVTQVTHCVTKYVPIVYSLRKGIGDPCSHGNSCWPLSVFWVSHHDPVPFERSHTGRWLRYMRNEEPCQALIQHLWALPVNTSKTTAAFWETLQNVGCPEATRGVLKYCGSRDCLYVSLSTPCAIKSNKLERMVS